MKFIPKVGEECQTGIGNGVVKVESDKYGICCVEILGELKLIHCDSLHAIKTHAEIESEGIRNTLIENMRITQEEAATVSDILTSAGYRKQQVKPLSYNMLVAMCIDNKSTSTLYNLLKPYTIQGGDK